MIGIPKREARSEKRSNAVGWTGRLGLKTEHAGNRRCFRVAMNDSEGLHRKCKQRDQRETTSHAKVAGGYGYYSVSDVDQIPVQTRLARNIPMCMSKEGANKYELREAELTLLPPILALVDGELQTELFQLFRV